MNQFQNLANSAEPVLDNEPAWDALDDLEFDIEFEKALERELQEDSPIRRLFDNLGSIFVSTSDPSDVRVSPPLLEAGGAGWTACVRAEVNSATGKPIGSETFQITIDKGQIIDRKRVGDDDNCASESYQPI